MHFYFRATMHLIISSAIHSRVRVSQHTLFFYRDFPSANTAHTNRGRCYCTSALYRWSFHAMYKSRGIRRVQLVCEWKTFNVWKSYRCSKNFLRKLIRPKQTTMPRKEQPQTKPYGPRSTKEVAPSTDDPYSPDSQSETDDASIYTSASPSESEEDSPP